MMKKIFLLLGVFWLMTNVVLAQTKPRPASGKAQMKTVRLHIDGFSKSKSGAV